MDTARIGELMEELGRAATSAAAVLALAPGAQKNAALVAAAQAVRARHGAILAANEHDMAAARARHLSGPRLERLRLDERRLEAVAAAIDAGALRALLEGRSLLPAGVTGTRGRFDRGDTVSVLTSDGSEVARGIIAYSDGDAARIMGRKSSEIAELLGFRGRDEMIHRDDLVLLRPEAADAAAVSAPQPAP